MHILAVRLYSHALCYLLSNQVLQQYGQCSPWVRFGWPAIRFLVLIILSEACDEARSSSILLAHSVAIHCATLGYVTKLLGQAFLLLSFHLPGASTTYAVLLWSTWVLVYTRVQGGSANHSSYRVLRTFCCWPAVAIPQFRVPTPIFLL